MIGMLIEPTSVRIAATRAGARRSSKARQSAIRPRYMRKRTSKEVSRASHTQYVPHIGLPQSEPVTSAEEGEGGAERRGALGRDVGERMPPDQRAERRDRHQRRSRTSTSQAAGTWMYMIRTRLALLVVGRRDEEGEVEADREQRSAVDARRATAGRRREKARKRVGLARSVRLAMACGC